MFHTTQPILIDLTNHRKRYLSLCNQQTEDMPMPEAPKKEKRTPDFSHLGDTEQKILSCIDDTISAEEIARRMKEKHGVAVDMGTLLGMLTMFELDGLLVALPGGSFRPTWND